jgi:hypothetical protein
MTTNSQKIQIFKSYKNLQYFFTKQNEELQIQQKLQVNEFMVSRNNLLELEIMRTARDMEFNKTFLQKNKEILDLLFDEITTKLEFKNEEFIQELKKIYLKG